MSTRPSAALPGRAAVRFGVGTTFVYDGETVTIVEMTATGYGNDVRVTDRGGQRCYWLSARELWLRVARTCSLQMRVRTLTMTWRSPERSWRI
jgi:hypothetical protein